MVSLLVLNKYLPKKLIHQQRLSTCAGAGDWKDVYSSSKPPVGFPDGSDSEESACNVGNLGSIPGLGKSPGVGNGNPLQYFGLENSMDRRAWWATVHVVAKSQTLLND